MEGAALLTIAAARGREAAWQQFLTEAPPARLGIQGADASQTATVAVIDNAHRVGYKEFGPSGRGAPPNTLPKNWEALPCALLAMH